MSVWDSVVVNYVYSFMFLIQKLYYGSLLSFYVSVTNLVFLHGTTYILLLFITVSS